MPCCDLTLTIEELAGGGDGVGRVANAAVFVPDTAPGDRVRVQVRERRRRWWRAELVEVLEPGPGRQPSACPLSPTCGGCQWHHLRYADQLAAKGGILARAFRQARVDAPRAELVAAPAALGYRCRARLQWRRPAGGPLTLGFLGRRSHRVVDVAACPVLLPELSGLLSSLRAAFPPGGPEGEALVIGNEQGHAALALHGVSDPDAAATLGQALAPAVRGVRTRPLVDSRPGRATTWGTPEVAQQHTHGDPFWTAPETFFQAYPAQNRQLVALVADWAGPAQGLCVELFAGSGNLTGALARRGEVIAVELDPEAAALARRNLAGSAVAWRTGDAAAELALLADAAAAPDLLVLDPPRTGARGLVDGLARLGPRRILYVSCDPMTLARDVADLAGVGYALSRVTALDTMPQTHHFETLAELRRA